jgi:uncharacterized protein YjbI with pentapeptide repeats
MQLNLQLIQLIIAYTLTGAFVFTVVTTCLSLIGLVRFVNQAQQRRLFSVLIVQLCVVAVGFFSGFLKFNPIEVQQAILHDRMVSPDSTAWESEFRDSNFTSCDFDGSRFEKASFKGANFVGADFRGANLSSIVVDSRTLLPPPR